MSKRLRSTLIPMWVRLHDLVRLPRMPSAFFSFWNPALPMLHSFKLIVLRERVASLSFWIISEIDSAPRSPIGLPSRLSASRPVEPLFYLALSLPAPVSTSSLSEANRLALALRSMAPGAFGPCKAAEKPIIAILRQYFSRKTLFSSL